MIEEVKKILEDNITLHSVRQGYGVFNITSFDIIAQQICQLFESKLLFNPDGTPDIQAMLKELKELGDALDKLIEKEMEKE